MAGRWTLGIVKPDAVADRRIGAILAHIERAGFRIRAARMLRMTMARAEAFYAVHHGRPFYPELVAFMSSGPCLAMALEADDAVAAFRRVIGATDPAEAEEGTIRKLYAESKGRNAVHGSDSDENAVREIGFFFGESDRADLGFS
jgi:nucleoside-diphosphate kinase